MSREYLKKPDRISTILNHRQFRADLCKRYQISDSETIKVAVNMTFHVPFESKLPKNFRDLKPITLNEIDKRTDRVYKKRVLELTLIDEPMLGMNAAHFVVQDTNKDVTRLSVYEIPHDEQTLKRFAFGTVILVINPYLRVAVSDGKPGIRVDDPRTIFPIGWKVNMCRYCGEENAPNKCSICKRNYCNRECQEADWKLLKHKLVCRSQILVKSDFK